MMNFIIVGVPVRFLPCLRCDNGSSLFLDAVRKKWEMPYKPAHIDQAGVIKA